METVDRYRTIITDCLHAEAAIPPSVGDVAALVIADPVSDNYVLIATGWQERRRVHATIIHIRLCAGAISIEYDGTEAGITPQLLQAGIPPEAIVFAFMHPSARPATAVAIA